MVISKLKSGSKITLDVTSNGNKISFETEYIRGSNPDSKRIYAVCKPVFSNDGKWLSFTGTAVTATIHNVEDNRDYSYVLNQIKNDQQNNEMRLYCSHDIKPTNYRAAHRVPCGYNANIQIGGNRKAIDAFVHDISCTGISFVYDKDLIKSEVGQHVSSMVYENKNEGIGQRVEADVVRIVDDYREDKVLIGAQVTSGENSVNKIVAKCQLKEARTRHSK